MAARCIGLHPALGLEMPVFQRGMLRVVTGGLFSHDAARMSHVHR
jgi:uncharacterized protein (DUF1501 family)